MNQSILFPDMQSWDEERQLVSFPAQQSGALISCVVSLDKLSRLSGKEVENGQQALAIFEQYRFDLEELAEEYIEEETFNAEGEAEIS